MGESQDGRNVIHERLRCRARSFMPPASRSKSLLDHFSALEDPREGWRVLYPLPEILLLVLCATLAGMEDFVEIVLWGQQRLDFLRRFLPYERGLPAHDTLNDVITGSTRSCSRP